MTVQSLVEKRVNASSVIQLTAVPESVADVTVTDYHTTSVTLQWTLKECLGCSYDEFQLTHDPDGTGAITIDHVLGRIQYEAAVAGLIPGRSYVFTVVARSGVNTAGDTPRTSEGNSIQQTTVPANPSGLAITPSERWFRLTWSPAEGDCSGYVISVDPDEGRAVFNGDLLNPGGAVRDLRPGTLYQMTVATISGSERSPGIVGLESTLSEPASTSNNSSGQIIGAVAGVVVLLIVIIGITVFMVRRKMRKPDSDQTNSKTDDIALQEGKARYTDRSVADNKEGGIYEDISVKPYMPLVFPNKQARHIGVINAVATGPEGSHYLELDPKEYAYATETLPPLPPARPGRSPKIAVTFNLCLSASLEDPANLIINNEGSTDSLNVTWTPPSGAESQNVSWYLADGDVNDIMYHAVFNGSESQYLIEDLTAGALYIVTVTAYNGTNSSSAEEEGRTLPNQVVLSPGGSTTDAISASWDKPAGVVDQYNISCSNGTASPATIDADSDHPVNASCTGLYQAGDEYNMTVTSISGDQTNEATIMLGALPNQADLIPGDSTTDSVTASWDKPAGVVDQYNISCSNGTASPATIDANSDHPVNASCTGLYQAGDEYIMIVTTISGHQTNEDSITLRALPNQVDLSAGDSTTDTISASWYKPAGVVDQYNISCSNGTASPATVDANSDHPVNASCTGLYQAGDEYIMTVTSISGHQTNEASIMLRALPNQVVLRPGIPTNETVSLSWDKPAGVVDQYNISCSNGTASPATIDADSDHPVNASCIALNTAGAEYTMTVTSISGDQTTEATITLFTLPNAVVLVEGMSTTDSVSANWVNPAGLVSFYTIGCSNGTASPSFINVTAGAQYNATCEGLPVPGATYTMTVTSFSNGQNNMADIILTAVPLPLNLQPDVSTETSVSAVWRHPGGVIEKFAVECSEGVPGDITEDYLGDEDLYQVSCENVSTPGDTYLMTVTSISGRQENPATVNLTALPEAVTLREESSNTTAITASWEVPDSVLDTFIITCSDGSASPSEISVTSDQRGNTLTASCIDLPTPGENYTITVGSRSSGKESARSSLGIIALPEAVTLREESSNTTAISASWEMPDSVMDTFIISCSDGSASPGEISVTSDQRGDTLTASCIDLPTPGENYTITVGSRSSGKESAPSSLGIIALPEAVTLREEASNTTAITASWEVPDSVMDTFNITCSNGSASPGEISVTSDQRGDTLTASCIHLPTPGEEYTITVVSLSNGKESVPSSLGIIALPNGVELREGNSTTTSVSAQWEKQNEPVDSYTISCSEGNASPPNITVTDEDLGPFNASCVNLPRTGAVYTMIVYSLSGETSNSSSTIHLRTVPESVENVTIRDYNTTAVNVEWTLKNCDCVYNEFSLTYEPDGTDSIIVAHSNQMMYSAQVTGLTQGRQYIFTVVTTSGDGASGPSIQTSEGKAVQQRTIPAAVTNMVITPNQRQLDLTWTRADGEVSGYDIMVDPSEGQATFNGNLTNPGGTVLGLTPGTDYTVTVVTVSQDERSECRVESSRTLTDTPSPVQNPAVTAVDKNTIRVTWERPAHQNGEITEYRIEYIGTRETHRDTGSATTADTSIDITDLIPGFSYTFMITAVNDGGYVSDPASTDSVETPEEHPPQADPNYDYGSITEPTGVSTTSFTVTLPEDLFSHENGELTVFTVIISEIGSRKRRATAQLDVGQVDIGVESCPTGTTGYCNGPLKDDTEYYYAFRAYNGAGAVNSATFGPVATAAPNGLLIGAAVGIPLAVIGIIAITVCIVRRTKKTPDSDLTAAKTDDIALQEGRYSDRGVADNEEV
ncbi:receptor-type tyrosine-protein phosphatase beta-like [Diadema antillarum]|uniref:receptor-type tyrosine-protein phosphatase beta-like n=1 Tax=Diadema antillarum TaxID=105358 RepID=UPI003A8439D5